MTDTVWQVQTHMGGRVWVALSGHQTEEEALAQMVTCKFDNPRSEFRVRKQKEQKTWTPSS